MVLDKSPCANGILDHRRVVRSETAVERAERRFRLHPPQVNGFRRAVLHPFGPSAGRLHSFGDGADSELVGDFPAVRRTSVAKQVSGAIQEVARLNVVSRPEWSWYRNTSGVQFLMSERPVLRDEMSNEGIDERGKRRSNVRVVCRCMELRIGFNEMQMGVRCMRRHRLAKRPVENSASLAKAHRMIQDRGRSWGSACDLRSS